MTPNTRIVLRERLNNFYATVPDYIAFGSISNQHQCWTHIEDKISKRFKKSGKKSTVLEIGPGKSGFGNWLKERNLREKVLWTVQNVTVQNASWLNSQADITILEDIGKMPSQPYYNIVFSTYVLEHVSNPKNHLDLIYFFLKVEGKLFIFYPRYDIRGYLCPSSYHLKWYT